MKKYIIFFFTAVMLFFALEKYAYSNEVYFIDFSKVMNQSIAGKKAQDYLKKELTNSNKKFSDTAKKLREEENKIISQKNVLDKAEYKKKADALRKKVFNLNKERESSIKNIAAKRRKAKDELFKNLNPILGKYMEEKGIGIIVDKKNVLMGNKKFEVTSDVINILNKELKSINLN